MDIENKTIKRSEYKFSKLLKATCRYALTSKDFIWLTLFFIVKNLFILYHCNNFDEVLFDFFIPTTIGEICGTYIVIVIYYLIMCYKHIMKDYTIIEDE
jgi:multisubunit Na+/H+ antiporter MnhB subunit